MSQPARVLNTELHAVVFSGKLLPGQQQDDVRLRLQTSLKLSPEQAARLFDGRPVTIKRGLDWNEAQKYQTVFRRLGAMLTIHPDTGSPMARPRKEPPVLAPETTATPKAASPKASPETRAAAPLPSPAPRSPDTPEAATPPRIDPEVVRPAPPLENGDKPETPAPTKTTKVKAAKPAARLQRIQPEPITARDHLRLNLTAAAMFILPLLYLGVLVLLSHVLFDRLTDVSLFSEHSPVLAALLYLVPAGLLGLFAYLWLEPVLQRHPADADELELNPINQPELHAWCTQLCQSLDVPVPGRISLSFGAHSRAELTSGLTSLWHQELSLKLSALQLAGLKSEELSGIVGYELARFGQWQVMKLAYLIDGVHNWFARGVEAESVLSAPLVRLGERCGDSVRPVIGFLLAGLGYLRKPLHGLLFLSELLSRPVMRDLCFRADRSAAQLHGGKTYREALLHAAWLEEMDQLAEAKNWQAWAEGRLVDDRIQLTLRFARQAPEEFQQFRQELDAADIRRWARRPSVAERMAALDDSPEGILSGKLGVEPRARGLLQLTRELTDTHYLNAEVLPGQGKRISASQMLSLTQDQDEALAALERYLHGWHRDDRFLPMPAVESLVDNETGVKIQHLQEAVDRLRQKLPDISRLYTQFDNARQQVQRLLIARVRLELGENLPELEQHRIDNALEGALASQNGRLIDIQAIESLLGQRLAWALALAFAKREPAEQKSLGELLAVVRGLHRLQPALDELAQNGAMLSALNGLTNGQQSPRLLREIRQRSERLREQLLALRTQLGKLPNPLASGSLADYALPNPLPMELEASALVAEETGLREQIAYLNRRLNGQLARIAELEEDEACIRPLKTRLQRTPA